MQVYSFGIALATANKGAGISDIFSKLDKKNGADYVRASQLRRIYVDTTSDPQFYLGLVVTVKDQRSFLQLQSGVGSLKIKVSHVKGTNKLMEFNFFIINKSNGLGLYQYYHGSCSPLTFGSYLKTEFREISDALRDAEISKVGTERGKGKREKIIKEKFKGGLDFQQLVRKENIQSILSEYKRIVSFNFDLVALSPVKSYAQPLSGFVRKVREKISFNADAPVDMVAKGISDMMSSVVENSARVSVINDDDEPVSVRVVGMPENFGEADYDQVADALDDLDLDNFSSNLCIAALRDTCVTVHPKIFMAKFK